MLQAGWGRIVNIASTAGLEGYAYVAAYSAAKHGVIGLTRSLALEVAKKNITVNAVCPGYTETDILRESIANVVAKTGRTRRRRARAVQCRQSARAHRVAERGRGCGALAVRRRCVHRSPASRSGSPAERSHHETTMQATRCCRKRRSWATRRARRRRPRGAEAVAAHARVQRQIEAEIRRRLRAHFGISLARFDYMAQLYRHRDGLKMSELSRYLMVTGGNVTGLTDELEREGWCSARATRPTGARGSCASRPRAGALRDDGARARGMDPRAVRRPRRQDGAAICTRPWARCACTCCSTTGPWSKS